MVRFFICCFVIVPVSLGFSDEPTKATPDVAAKSVDTDFVDMFPADTDTLWRIGDSLPHLRRLLSAPQLRRVLMDGKLGQTLPGVDPQKGLQGIQQFAIYIPDEIIVGVSSQSLDQIGRFLNTCLLWGLSSGAVEVDAAKSPDLIRQAARELEQFEIPRLVFWIRFRDPNIAEGLYRTAGGLVSGVATQNTDLEVVSKQDVFGLRGTVGTFLPAELIPAMMLQLGLIKDASSDDVQRTAELIADLTTEVWLEHSGNGLRITVGERITSDAPKLTFDQLSSLWQPLESRYIYGQWNTRSVMDKLLSIEALWQQWEQTPTGRALQAKDTEDILGDLSLIIRQFQQAGPEGSMRIDVTDSIDGLSVSRDGKAAVPLDDLLKSIPQSVEVVAISGTDSLAAHFSGLLSSFEDRMATNSMKYELQAKDLQAEMMETVTQFYYTKLANFRKLVHESALSKFEPPYAMLIDSKGKIAKLDIHINPGAPDANRVTLNNIPMLEYAVIGKATNPDSVLEFPGQVWAAFISGFGKAPAESEATRQEDLGLERPTLVFDSSFLDRVPQLNISLAGPMRPHCFLLDDGWFVFSTSSRLSKSIVDAAAGNTSNLNLDDQQNLAGYGTVPGATVARYFDDIGQLLADFLGGGGERVTITGPLAKIRSPQAAQIGVAVQGLGEVVGLMKEFRWRTVDSAQQRTTTFSVTFAE